jgi:regulatory protein
MTEKNKNPGFPPELAVVMRKARDYCALEEHCISEVEKKLKDWKVDRSMHARIISMLVSEDFINEQRYADAFVRGKFRNLCWGKVKLRYELERKKIASGKINEALGKLDEEEYARCLAELAKKKAASLGSNVLENQFKVARFLLSKGFEPELIRGLLI